MTRLPQIATMAELRLEIDRLDAALVDLLAERTAMIDRAIELKPGEGLPARIESRVEDVVAKVRARAIVAGLPPDLAETLWREMMEFFIAREESVLGKGDDGE
ncbi:chorismate mutase [Frigidibacter mobilis]|uniref:chorismate mutase n=1 Tax=Frigidibacter mobilis TaxID=1335048 RepID=A0A159Z634_9RHOB|nr:chorismate mutase [Frigidibacter mobilis]AMY70772.1 chorismate mutase family protein [Frigidibacter mobilis]